MTTNPEYANDPKLPISAKLGIEIVAMRNSRGLSQKELAAAAGISSPQLCHLEKGLSEPSIGTLLKIAGALGVSIADLVDPVAETHHYADDATDESEPRPIIRRASCAQRGYRPRQSAKEPYSGLLYVHDPDECFMPDKTRASLANMIKEYIEIEKASNFPRTPSIQLKHPSGVESGAGPFLARKVRSACGIGTAAIFDAVEFFECLGIRVMKAKLPSNVGSWALFDPVAMNPFVFLQSETTVERRRFRMAYEMAHVFRFVTNGMNPIPDTRASRRFSREFAASFLIPEEAVRECVHQLAVGPRSWTFDLLLIAKSKFGISAEMFAYRLDELGLITRTSRNMMLKKIEAWYQANGSPELMEPQPQKITGRMDAMRIRASLQSPNT